MAEYPERVNHPAHYGGADNPYETIKVLEAWLTREEFIGFLKGQVIKYSSRAGKHVAGESADQDFRKAQWYQNYLVDFIKRRPQ